MKGEVVFPTVSIEKDFIDFGEVLNGTEAVREIIISNPGSYCITYKMYIKPKSTFITHTRPEDNSLTYIPDPDAKKPRAKPKKVKHINIIIPILYHLISVNKNHNNANAA